MATAGLSLVGFMDQSQAINHLLNACVFANLQPVALIAEWTAAKAKLGAPTPNAGAPDIQPIPAAHQQHIQQLLAQDVFQPPHGVLQGATVQVVEIDPLLALQFTIDNPRSNYHCASMSRPPTLAEMLPVCLPLTPQNENIQTFPGRNR